MRAVLLSHLTSTPSTLGTWLCVSTWQSRFINFKEIVGDTHVTIRGWIGGKMFITEPMVRHHSNRATTIFGWV